MHRFGASRSSERGNGAGYGAAVPVIESHVDTKGDTYRANREAMLDALAEHDRQLDIVNNGGGDTYVARHRARGKLPVRERV